MNGRVRKFLETQETFDRKFSRKSICAAKDTPKATINTSLAYNPQHFQ